MARSSLCLGGLRGLEGVPGKVALWENQSNVQSLTPFFSVRLVLQFGLNTGLDGLDWTGCEQ